MLSGSSPARELSRGPDSRSYSSRGRPMRWLAAPLRGGLHQWRTAPRVGGLHGGGGAPPFMLD
jgi:hypothetical protein